MNVIRRVLSLEHSNVFNVIHRSVAYKSAISLDNLYPSSNLKLTSPTKPETSLSSKFSGFIPVNQLEITYSRSTGPGGQNVNKINTKVDMRFHLDTAEWLDADIRSKLAEKHKTKLTKEGYLIFRSDLTRSQQMNLADCLNKLRMCIVEVTQEAAAPSADTVERIRRRQEKAIRERLIQKRLRSQTKADRKAPSAEDF
ncbi:PREDICTED: peptidyl-tRNA hydrolase ICT1, mitochondrial [Nicrophorus vespilloides]|uniref:Large ribosomal subunit protein mL62 n=1 Tax=Nicrophorus vespilloides TaxID=110193 RepID=A0ABM1MJ83_NICVS|nr:PREDICTED: peptidyl-tRNA hydrolase ICT1, mitochondrial [Nicrophorus vespilloides]